MRDMIPLRMAGRKRASIDPPTILLTNTNFPPHSNGTSSVPFTLILQMLSEQGLGLMVATHDVDFAWRWATRVLVFRGGRLAGDGEPREIFENVSLLRTCGLEQPVLYRVGRVLGLAAPPHTVEELEQEWKP